MHHIFLVFILQIVVVVVVVVVTDALHCVNTVIGLRPFSKAKAYHRKNVLLNSESYAV